MEAQKRKAYIFIAIGVLSISLSAILVKMTTSPSGVTAFYRLFFSVLLMAPVFWMRYRNEVRNLALRDWLLCALAGVFLAFHFILWFESLNYTSVASSTVLVTLQPLFSFAGTWFFFKEVPKAKDIVGGAVAILGSVIIGISDFRASGSALYGDALALAGCALVTAYMLLGQSARRRLSVVSYTFLVYAASSIALLCYVLAKGESLGPYPAMDWFWFILLAIIPNLLGHSLFSWALEFVSANVISIAVLFEPVGAAILAYFIFQEGLEPLQIFGGIVVILGICLFVFDPRRLVRPGTWRRPRRK